MSKYRVFIEEIVELEFLVEAEDEAEAEELALRGHQDGTGKLIDSIPVTYPNITNVIEIS